MGRMKKYDARWSTRTYRVTPANRDYLEATARAVGFPLESVVRMAIKRFAICRRSPLPDWAPLEAARSAAFFVGAEGAEDRGMPRVYVRMRAAWPAHLSTFFRGEVRSLAGVVREAILSMAEEDPADVAAAFAAEKEPTR